MSGAGDLEAVYGHRFSDGDEIRKMAIWAEIVRVLERWIAPGATVLDVACDQGYFIRNVHARERWATDIRDLSATFGADVRFVQANGLDIASAVPASSFDVVFMSNYLEHLPSSDAVIDQLRAAQQVLRPGGRLIVLQPNIRLVGGAYWDFIDHKVPLTERSLVEAAETAGLRIEHLVPRFLPYTTKGRMPQRPSLVRAYLRIPIAWRLLGKQTLMVARRPEAGE